MSDHCKNDEKEKCEGCKQLKIIKEEVDTELNFKKITKFLEGNERGSYCVFAPDNAHITFELIENDLEIEIGKNGKILLRYTFEINQNVKIKYLTANDNNNNVKILVINNKYQVITITKVQRIYSVQVVSVVGLN